MKNERVRELCVGTISELKRRGWTTGTLGRIYQMNAPDLPEEECEVCLLGAASSAYNPFHPFVPGYGDDYDWDSLDVKVWKNPEYREFVALLNDEAIRRDPDSDNRGLQAAVFYNDQVAQSVDDVIALLQGIHDAHLDATEVA